MHIALQIFRAQNSTYIWFGRSASINIYSMSLRSWKFKIDTVEPSRDGTLYECPIIKWVIFGHWNQDPPRSHKQIIIGTSTCVKYTIPHLRQVFPGCTSGQIRESHCRLCWVSALFFIRSGPRIVEWCGSECFRTLNAIVYWPRCRAWHSVTKCAFVLLFRHPNFCCCRCNELARK